MIIFPMAGRSSRFTKAGYDRPKYMLEAHGKTVFEHVTGGFKAYFGKECLLFIVLAEDGVADFIRDKCSSLGLHSQHYQVVELEEPTQGQAETIAKGLKAANVDKDESLTIFNIDTIRPGFQYPSNYNLKDIDGYLEVFNAEGDGWSFVEPAHDNSAYSVSRVTEKVRISDLCSTGLYYFRSVALFLDVYESILLVPVSELQGGERYVAPLYNLLIKGGADIRYQKIGSDEIILCGIPEQYEAFKAMPFSG